MCLRGRSGSLATVALFVTAFPPAPSMKPDRRSFLTASAAAAAASLLGGARAAAATPANRGRTKLAVATYSYWHFKTAKVPVETVMDRAAELGAEGVDILHRQMEIGERAPLDAAGRAYLRELSIDELPGLTAPETTAVMLALCEALGMRIHFVAPAFGFQKNMPYPDNAALRTLIEKQWAVCRNFGASIGFHSGSGKSAENYRVMGQVTGGRLEIKTSGRYTYEMGRALFASKNAADQAEAFARGLKCNHRR